MNLELRFCILLSVFRLKVHKFEEMFFVKGWNTQTRIQVQIRFLDVQTKLIERCDPMLDGHPVASDKQIMKCH